MGERGRLLWILSDGKNRRIFLGLNFSIPKFWGGRKIWQIFSWVVWQSEGARVCRPRNSVCFLVVTVVVVVFGPAGGGLIFSPLILFWGGEGGVGNRTEFFGFRPNSIIPIITWNPEYPPHSWSQAIITRLYTFTSFSLKTITANGDSLYPWSLPDAGSSSLGKDYCSKGSAAKHNFTLYICMSCPVFWIT